MIKLNYTIRINSEEMKRVEEAAKALYMNRCEFVRYAIRQTLKEMANEQ
jgi:Arc/MetJ-type ribon-helix-helix transcriptional regulator